MKRSTILLIAVFVNSLMVSIFPEEDAFYIAIFICISSYFIVKLLEEKL